jgi:hypothetical protein
LDLRDRLHRKGRLRVMQKELGRARPWAFCDEGRGAIAAGGRRDDRRVGDEGVVGRRSAQRSVERRVRVARRRRRFGRAGVCRRCVGRVGGPSVVGRDGAAAIDCRDSTAARRGARKRDEGEAGCRRAARG